MTHITNRIRDFVKWDKVKKISDNIKEELDNLQYLNLPCCDHIEREIQKLRDLFDDALFEALDNSIKERE